MEITSLSSRGQIVLPQKIRKKLSLKDGEKFIVLEKDGVIILKKIKIPSLKDLNKLTK